MRKRRGFSDNAAPIGVRWRLMAVPRPCTVENILSGVDITVCDIATARTTMCTNRQTLLYELTTSVTFLRGETGVHSNNCVPSSLSLFTQNVEECAPTSVHDALCQGMILDHVENAQLLHRDHPVLVGIAFGGLILEVTALTGNLEMRLCRTTSSP